MITNWLFEPCSPEDNLSPHAVKGTSPHGTYVIGYGDTPELADADAREKAGKVSQGGTFTTTGPCTLLVGDGRSIEDVTIVHLRSKGYHVPSDERLAARAKRVIEMIRDATIQFNGTAFHDALRQGGFAIQIPSEATTLSLSEQSEALIRLAGVPFADLEV